MYIYIYIYSGSLLVIEYDHLSVNSLLSIALSLMSLKVTHQSWK